MKKFENKVIEKVLIDISIRKVELNTRIHNLEALVKKIQDLHITLCDMPRFTNEFQSIIQKIELYLKSLGSSVSQKAGSSAMHYNRLLHKEDWPSYRH